MQKLQCLDKHSVNFNWTTGGRHLVSFFHRSPNIAGCYRWLTHEIMATTRAVGEFAILNSGDSSLQSLPSAVELSRQLQKLMLNIKGNFISREGHEVDYTALKDSDLFREYVERTKALKVVDLGSLERKEKIAFFLSIFYAGSPLFLACMQQPDLFFEMSPVLVEADRVQKAPVCGPGRPTSPPSALPPPPLKKVIII